MWVLSVEGPAYVDRTTWATHRVLGAWPTLAEATENVPGVRMLEEVLILTDTSTGKACRIGAGDDPVTPAQLSRGQHELPSDRGHVRA